MADIPSALTKIQIEETKYKAAISEASMTRMGGVINYMIDQFVSIPLTTLSRQISDNTGNIAFNQKIYLPINFIIKAVSFQSIQGSFAGVGTTSFDIRINGVTSIFSAPVSNAMNGVAARETSFMKTNSTDFSGDFSLNVTGTETLNSGVVLSAGDYLEVFFTVTGNAFQNTAAVEILGNKDFP